jgi:clan AA aspartic protease
MIRGHVEGLQAKVNVPFRVEAGRVVEIEFVVDTGFAGALTLPREAITALGLPFFVEMDAKLANDLEVKADVYIAVVAWGGRDLDVAVLAMGQRPLLGTALLKDHHLGVDFADSGLVSIDGLA